ncbi:MAG: hypothetical protein LBJ48_04620 [Coriobacteriales bacterium]|jgi:hypothetical protein|nr:hypothetical protein [Coriobacteriales bacterium]
MREEEIRTHYELLQDDIHTSEELKQRTLAQAQGMANAKSSAPIAGRPAHARQPRAIGRHIVWRRITAVAAACLAVVVLGIGISVLSRDNTTGTPAPASTPANPLDFSIQAYAYGSDQFFSPNPNGVLFFEADMLGEGFIPGSEASLREWGAYTGCVFSIKGEGITRVQIVTSKGELYRYIPWQQTGDTDPEFIKAARAWKPGHDALMGEYDNVNVRVPLNYSEIKNSGTSEAEMLARLYSAETTWNIDLMKRLGPVADIGVTTVDGQQAGDYLFGLWINEGVLGFDTLLDSFDGQTLSITAWFEDGHQSAMILELDPVDIKVKPIYVDAPDGGQRHLGFEFTDEVVDLASLDDQQRAAIYEEGYAIMHTLRGTLVYDSYNQSLG